MKILENRLEYLDQFIELVEEYRTFCGFSPAPDKTRSFFQNLLDSNESVTFIAVDEDNNDLMGFVNLYPSYSTLSLQRLYILNDLGVSQKYRNMGIAKSLINKVIDFAKTTNAVRIELKTQKTNTQAQKLYASLGFAIDSENIHYTIPL